jgi:hypothetical protein
VRSQTESDSGLSPTAALQTGSQSATVVYQCADQAELAGVNPASGAVEWDWRPPQGWTVQAQTPAGFSSGVVAVLASGAGAVSPHRSSWSSGPVGDATDEVVALDETTGRPLWQMDGVPDSAGVYAGGGQVCAASAFGVQCDTALTGAPTWRWRPEPTPGNGGPAGTDPGIAASAGRLYLIAPTRAAESIDPESTTDRSPAGAFHLQVMDMATGKVIDDQPLPAFYAGPNQVVVSVETPPGVVAVGAGTVFIEPELHETEVVEALPAHASPSK